MSSNETFLSELDGYINKGIHVIDHYQSVAESMAEPRRYQISEAVELALLNNRQKLYRAEAAGQIEPARQMSNNRRYYTLDDLNNIRDYFGTKPGKALDEPTPVLAFTSFKGGTSKTTTAFQFTGYLAHLGYKVLLVDLDPQATMSLLMDMEPDIKTDIEHTLGPLLLTDEPDKDEIRDAAIHPTRLKTVDIMPACMQLQTVEMMLVQELLEARAKGDKNGMIGVFYRLGMILDKVKNDYDIVVVDGTPSLGIIPLNIICSCSSIIVPVPMAINDFASSNTFLRLLQDYMASVFDIGLQLPVPQMKFVATRFSTDGASSRSSKVWEENIKKTYGGALLNSQIHKHDSVVGNSLTFHRSAFEINHGDIGIPIKTMEKARQDYATLFDEILESCVFPQWPSRSRK